MRMSRRLRSGLAAVAVAAGMTAAALPAQAATAAPAVQAQTVAVMAPAHMGVELQAVLRGSGVYRHATGHASYEADSHREMHVSLAGLGRLAGHRLVVYVHGAKAGTLLVSRTGHAVLDMHRGVPLCKAGQPIRIRTLTGTLVVSGAFMPHHDD